MWVIETDIKNCRDCNKCLKECPVKAIKFENGVSRIVEERCVVCGNCIRVCPQNAKKDISYMREVKHLVRHGETVVASLAPSFAAFFTQSHYRTIVTLLKKLGFHHVEETAFGAYYTAMATIKEIEDKPGFWIGSACPASNNLIEKYFPQFIPHLSRADSPVIAHAKLIKDHYGEDAHTVFISPCAAKKQEVMEDDVRGLIDFPISFKELLEWADDCGIDLQQLEAEDDFERVAPGEARLFPIRGGILKAANMESDYTSTRHLSVSGAENIYTFLENFKMEEYPNLQFVDFLMCEGGCINGPLGWKQLNPLNRIKVTEYQLEKPKSDEPAPEFPLDKLMVRRYRDLRKVYPEPDEKEIKTILNSIGKVYREDELNCGGCGYATCREKAIAVFQGMAEAEMCLPYMRKKAESLANVLVEHTPNGIVLLNRQMKILNINPAFRRLFNLRENVDLSGQSIKTLVPDISPLLRSNSQKTLIEHKEYYESVDKWLRLVAFPMIDEGVVVGLFQDITREEQQKQELDNIRKEIAEHTHDVILKQMRVAQEIAGLLGETTAETKAMLSKLVRVLTNDGGDPVQAKQ